MAGTEAPDTAGITTAKEYSMFPRPSYRLFRAISSYKRFRIELFDSRSTCGPDGRPIIYAKHGFKAGKSGRRLAARISKSS